MVISRIPVGELLIEGQNKIIIFDKMLDMVCYVLHTTLTPTSKAMCLVISNNRTLICSDACVKRTCGKCIDPIYPS